MLNMRNKLAKRIMAFVLSGAMVISGLAPSGMTAYAAEASTEISTETVEDSFEETEESEAKAVSDDTGEETPDEDSGADAKEEETQVSDETVKATETEIATNEQTDEMKSSSLSAEKDSTTAEDDEDEGETEKDEDAENVKEAPTLKAIPKGESATFGLWFPTINLVSGDDATETVIDGTVAVALTNNTTYIEKTNSYFSITANNSKFEIGKKNASYYYDSESGTIKDHSDVANTDNSMRFPLGSGSIDFETSEAVDLTVFWAMGGNDRIMTVEKKAADGTVQETVQLDETAQVYARSTKPLVSVITLDEAGKYSIKGNNYILNVEVAPKKDKITKWDFKNDSKFNNLGTNNTIGQYSLDIAGLRVVHYNTTKLITVGGIGASTGSSTEGPYIFVPVPKDVRSDLVITTAEGKAGYSVNDTAATADSIENTFTCDGTENYAKITITGDTLIECIEVKTITTHTISGTVEGISADDKADAKIVFTDQDDETSVIDSAIDSSNGSYSVELYEGSTYTISIGGNPEYKDKYKVTTPETGTVSVENADQNNVKVVVEEDSNLVPISGSIAGFEALPENFKLTFKGSDNSTPTVTVNSDKTYNVSLQPEIEYTITVEGKRINDYDFSPKTMKSDATETNITFTSKGKSVITIDKVTEGLYKDNVDLKNFKITFKHEDGDEYTDTFGINDTIELRDGAYTVSLDKPADSVKYMVTDNASPEGNGVAEYPLDVQLGTLEVSGATTYTLRFKERMIWDFAAEDPLLPTGDIQDNKDFYYNGLLVKTKSASSVGKFGVQGPANNRVQINDGAEVLIPVAGTGTVKITTDCYLYSIDGTAAATGTETGTEKTFTYENKPKGSYMVFKSTAGKKENGSTNSVYLKKIEITRTADPTGEIKPVKKHTIWIVGDSTVCSYIKDGVHSDDDRYYQRYGYGTMLDKYVDSNYYTINNIALSGRSSKSYLKEEKYKTLTSGIREGDILIIGFGHNDEKRNSTHYTNPNEDYRTEGSFAKSLYDNYVKIALDAKAQPILCTPIVHLRTDNNYAKEHITSDGTGPDADGNTIDYKGGNYPQAIRDLGTAVNVPVIDLTQFTGEKWAELGYDEAFYLHASEGSDPKVPDTTHVNSYGAKMIAHILATEIGKIENIDLAQHIINLDDVATKEDLELSINDPNKGDYQPPTAASKYGENFGIFKATAFGSINTEASAGAIALGKDANGNMNIKVTGDNGKITAKNDGIAMYYYQIPSDAKFSFSAKATINAIGDDEEAAFGLMARDDMYIDKADENILSNYVAAGTFAKNSVNCFYRNGKELKPGAAITAVKAGDTYELNISTTQDGYTCKFGDNELQANGYDFALAGIDSKYKYIGMFVSKNADITFSDIKLTVNDKEIDINDLTNAGDYTVEGDGGNVEIAKPDGFKAGNKYGYKSVATFEVLQDMPFYTREANDPAKDSYAISYDGIDYEGCVQGTTGPKDNVIPTEGQAAFKLTAIKDSKITFIVRENRSKTFYFIDAANTSDTSQNVLKGDKTDTYFGAKYTFTMKSGHTYYFYAGGSKVMVAAISIEKTAEGEGPDSSEENPSEPGTGEENPSEPGTGEEKPSDPASSEENPSEPGTGEEEPDTPDTKIPADDKLKTISINDKSKITIEAADVVYAKKQPYAITVTYTYEKKVDDKTESYQQQLTEGLHYTVDAGSETLSTEGVKTVTIKGTGKKTDLGVFINEDKATYEVLAKKGTSKTDISKVKNISLDKSLTKQSYTGTYVTPEPTIGIDAVNAEGKANYKVVYKNNVNVGKASITVIGQGDYYGAKVLPFTINKTDLSKTELEITSSNAKIDGSLKTYTAVDKATNANFEYKGTPVTLRALQIKVKGSDKALRAKEDYTVVYKKNEQAGKATLTIKGANNFSGSIKIDYTIEPNKDIATELEKFAPDKATTLESALPAEFSSKGARLTEINLSNGITLKENTDYKVKYGKDCQNVTAGQEQLITVTISGAGSYKNAIAKDTPVAIKVVKGQYHIKENTIVDLKKSTSEAKFINAAKITDASGAKIKPTDVTLEKFEANTSFTTIKVVPNDLDSYAPTDISCHVAEKLSSVKLPKSAIIPDQPFDGVNSVTLTEKRIEKYTGLKASDIRIVSYKNNNKLGSATVTIEATEKGQYYGTRNLKFKIALTASDRDAEEEETSPSGGSTEENPSEPSSEEKPSEPSSGGEESSTEASSESSSEESSEGEGSSAEDPDKPTPVEKRIDVWDFGAKQETNAEKYNNHIKVADWDNCSDASGGVFPDTSVNVTFGDLTIKTEKADRLFAPGSKNTNSGSTPKVGTADYGDGYTAVGGWYANGARSATKGYIELSNVSIGDRIDVYAGPHNGTETPFGFEGGDPATSGELGSYSAAAKMSFVAESSGKYKIYSNGGGKPFWCRIQKIPAADVSGTIDFGPLTATENVKLKFVNDTTKAETFASIEGTAFTAKLAAGYTYTANLSGATGYGFTNETKKVTITNDDALAGKGSVNLAVETKITYVYSGSITGFAEGYDTSKLAVTLKADPDSQSDDAALAIKEDLSFTATLDPDVTYTIVMEGANDYEITSEKTINKNAAYNADITVALRSLYTASGKFVDFDGKAIEGLNVTKLVFKNVDDEYEYEATVADSGYTVSLRDGAYIAAATAEGYSTDTHVVLEGKDAQKNLLFVSTAADAPLERVADLYVDKNDSTKYQTVSAAVKAAKLMDPKSESERITIHIAPGTYREQVIVEAPYVTFINDDPSKGEVLITWYYGVGYLYYSALGNNGGTDYRGYYDAQKAYDKYEKKQADRWGCAVRVKGAYFKAENIVFENSFNRYITDEEIEDGVEPVDQGKETKPVRNYSSDVASKAATERAAAISVDADYAEFYNCSFYSSQDTIQTGGKDVHSYWKNCFIEGNTDYIFGGGACVFDNCELSFAGYSGEGAGGYITAQRPEGTDNGYLFWNCTVTGNGKLTVAPGYFGRTWGADAKVTFVNTKLQRADIIIDAGWGSMNGEPENARYAEYNTVSLDGKAVDTSKRTAGTVKTENPVPDAAAFKAYFGSSWNPSYYIAEDETVAFTTDPFLSNNADLNSPHPGNTLTVSYSLGANNDKNDASIIQWYRVNDASEETLVKTSTAIAGKNYKVQTADEGHFIKVVVTPTVASGKAGEAKSISTENKIQQGWEEPGVADAVLGNGVNVFLAGDSTVKDYSAKGMYNSGKARDEGSWGEYLQSFFNEEKVTIVNYANGGRSTRNFINEGTLDKIKENIKEGDYLFIQFGHNDCSADYADRFVPVGEPDAEGKYPVTAGVKTTVDGKEQYEYNCGGTFKWFLKQYVDAAKEKNAIPVLVTPVSRMYYDKGGSGTIRTHHDCDVAEATGNTYKSENNAYVVAVKQLAEEEGVLLIDAFEFTKSMYEMAWTDSTDKSGDMCNYGSQLMAVKDGTGVDATHCNKLGGFIEAAYMTNAIKNLKDADDKNLNIASAIKAPATVGGTTTDGKTVFTVNNSGVFTAYDKLDGYASKADYWTETGTNLIKGMFLTGN